MAEGPAEDQNLNLGDQTMGVWTVEFMMYVPTGFTGYYNMQNAEATGQWNFDVFLAAGAGDYQEGGASISAFTYPEDQWFKLYHVVDLNNSTIRIELDDVEIHNGAYAGDMVGAVNFYANGATNTYYLDDVVVDGNPNVGIAEYTEGMFSVYPNPTEGMVTVQGEEMIDAIVVRDLLGAAVMRVESPYSNRVELDMNSLETGIYLLEVQVGEQISINRVVKN